MTSDTNQIAFYLQDQSISVTTIKGLSLRTDVGMNKGSPNYLADSSLPPPVIPRLFP